MACFLHLACSGGGHPVIEIFIERSNSSCLQRGIRGFDSFHCEITSCEDFEDSRNKKRDGQFLFPDDCIFTFLISGEDYFTKSPLPL